MKKSIDIKLQKERENLSPQKAAPFWGPRNNRLVNEAIKNGTPLSETQEIMKQCRKVNRIMKWRRWRQGRVLNNTLRILF